MTPRWVRQDVRKAAPHTALDMGAMPVRASAHAPRVVHSRYRGPPSRARRKKNKASRPECRRAYRAILANPQKRRRHTISGWWGGGNRESRDTAGTLGTGLGGWQGATPLGPCAPPLDRTRPNPHLAQISLPKVPALARRHAPPAHSPWAHAPPSRAPPHITLRHGMRALHNLAGQIRTRGGACATIAALEPDRRADLTSRGTIPTGSHGPRSSAIADVGEGRARARQARQPDRGAAS